MAYNILIVEDDQRIASVVRFHLERESYSCHSASDGDTGLRMAQELKPDLVVLDVMLPGKSGFDVCQGIRNTPGLVQPAILMLTARVEEVDVVMGLTFGADDYVRKPFGVKELVARVRSLLQRREARQLATSAPLDEAQAPSAGANAPHRADDGDAVVTPEPLLRPPLRIDPGRREVAVRGDVIELTPTEFDLLYFMARRPGRVFTREELLDHVWGYDHAGYARTIDSHIARVRRKVAEARGPKDVIQTVFRVGYRYRDDPGE